MDAASNRILSEIVTQCISRSYDSVKMAQPMTREADLHNINGCNNLAIPGRRHNRDYMPVARIGVRDRSEDIGMGWRAGREQSRSVQDGRRLALMLASGAIERRR